MKLKNDGPPLRSRSRCSVFTYSCTPQPPHVALRSMPRRDRGKGPRQSSKCEMDAASEGARAWRPSSVVPEESSTTRWWRGLPCRPMIGCAHGKTGRWYLASGRRWQRGRGRGWGVESGFPQRRTSSTPQTSTSCDGGSHSALADLAARGACPSSGAASSGGACAVHGGARSIACRVRRAGYAVLP